MMSSTPSFEVLFFVPYVSRVMVLLVISNSQWGVWKVKICGGVDTIPRTQGVSVRAGAERQFLQFLNRKVPVMLITFKCLQ